MLSGESDLAQHDDLAEAIAIIGTAIEDLQLRSADLSRAMGQAFVDALHDKESPLFDWLTQRCLIYVTACSLGLQPDAQRQVTSRIKELDLLLDTDVVLSLLGDAEANHNAVVDLIKTWRRIGGKIYVTGPVLEEVAYHAWVSERDMKSVWPHIMRYSNVDTIQLVPNVFVRGFRKVAKRMTLAGWGQYMANFRGSHERDYSKIRGLLKDEGVEVVTDEAVEEPLADLIAKELYQRKSSGMPASEPTRLANLQSKCSRDGRLVALLLAHRKQKQELGRSAVIVSSSAYLAAACRKFAHTHDAVEPVMNAGAVAYLLTFSPGVALSMRSLQRLLFDPGFGEQIGPLERRALQIIKSSNEYSLPFSRRHALRDEMHKSMARFASSRGESFGAVEERYANAENDDEFMQLVARSVDAFATSKSEEENRRLSKENEELKQRVNILERRAARTRK